MVIFIYYKSQNFLCFIHRYWIITPTAAETHSLKRSFLILIKIITRGVTVKLISSFLINTSINQIKPEKKDVKPTITIIKNKSYGNSPLIKKLSNQYNYFYN